MPRIPKTNAPTLGYFFLLLIAAGLLSVGIVAALLGLQGLMRAFL